MPPRLYQCSGKVGSKWAAMGAGHLRPRLLVHPEISKESPEADHAILMTAAAIAFRLRAACRMSDVEAASSWNIVGGAR